MKSISEWEKHKVNMYISLYAFPVSAQWQNYSLINWVNNPYTDFRGYLICVHIQIKKTLTWKTGTYVLL